MAIGTADTLGREKAKSIRRQVLTAIDSIIRDVVTRWSVLVPSIYIAVHPYFSLGVATYYFATNPGRLRTCRRIAGEAWLPTP